MQNFQIDYPFELIAINVILLLLLILAIILITIFCLRAFRGELTFKVGGKTLHKTLYGKFAASQSKPNAIIHTNIVGQEVFNIRKKAFSYLIEASSPYKIKGTDLTAINFTSEQDVVFYLQDELDANIVVMRIL